MTRADRNQPAFAQEDPHQALLRAVRFCHPGWDLVGPLSFRPETKASPVWKTWQDGVFSTVLLPQIFAAHAAASTGDLPGLLQADAAIDSELPSAGAVAARLSGHRLAAHFPAPPAEKQLARYALRIAEGQTPGQLAALMAARAAVFHFPPATAVAAYCFLEAKGALPTAPITEWMALVSDCALVARNFAGAALRAA